MEEASHSQEHRDASQCSASGDTATELHLNGRTQRTKSLDCSCKPLNIIKAVAYLSEYERRQVTNWGFGAFVELTMKTNCSPKAAKWLMEVSELLERYIAMHVKADRTLNVTAEVIHKVLRVPFGGTTELPKIDSKLEFDRLKQQLGIEGGLDIKVLLGKLNKSQDGSLDRDLRLRIFFMILISNYLIPNQHKIASTEAVIYTCDITKIDSGQQPHPRNMENEIDIVDRKIMSMIGCLSSSLRLNEGWYHRPEGIKRILEKLVEMENCKTVTEEMLKERIGKLERMVKDYHENRRSSLPHQECMLYVFSNVGRQYYEIVPHSPQSYGKRTALVSEELEAPSAKRSRSESVDMVMYLSHPDAASKFFSSGFSMEDCTSRAQRLFQDDNHMLYSAITLLRQNIEIRQSFMTLEESYARGYIEHELKASGMP